MITNAIGFAISGCTKEFDIQPNVVKLNATEFDKHESRHYKYDSWLSNVIENLQLDSEVKEKIEDLSSMAYPNWFNNNIEWVESEKISNVEFINAFKMLKKDGIIA